MAQRRVLVIDDARVIRLSVKSALEKMDIEVLELGNAEDLFQSAWKFQNIDLIILDIDLPGMDGITALQTIKTDPKWVGIPVIMLTGHSDPKLVRRAVSFGVADYIRKPFTTEDVAQRVEAVLSDEAVLARQKGRVRPPVPVHTYYAILTLDSSTGLPAGLSDLANPDPSSSLKPTGPFHVVFPFPYAGGLNLATTKVREYLDGKHWPTKNLRVVGSREEVNV